MISLDKVYKFVNKPFGGSHPRVLGVVCEDLVQAKDVFDHLFRWALNHGADVSTYPGKGMLGFKNCRVYVTCADGYKNCMGMKFDDLVFDSEVGGRSKLLFGTRLF